MEEVTKETVLDVVYRGTSFGVTNMDGKSITYLRDFMGSNGYLIPEDEAISVFSMGPNESNPTAILGRKMGILPRGMVEDKFQILQGEVLTVTSEYVLSKNDVVVKFGS